MKNWIVSGKNAFCPHCKGRIDAFEIPAYNFCPHCGEAMKNDAEKSTKQGHWIPVETETGIAAYGVCEMTVMDYKCSECGGLVDISESNFEYCPHCGSRMNGDAQ